MTEKELAERNQRAENLKVFQVALGNYFVESSKGHICYKVGVNNGTKVCTCSDYHNNVPKDPGFMCKHILAAMNSNGDAQGVNLTKAGRPKLDERFITTINKKGVEKEFVVYSGLLDLAHQKGLRKVHVEALQFPRKENGMEAICMATVITFSGETYTEIGDANPKNVTVHIAAHILRMAATRAKARAFRDMTNIGMTCLEELGDTDDAIVGSGRKSGKSPAAQKSTSKGSGSKKAKASSEKDKSKTDDDPKLSTAQKKAILNLAKRRGISEDELGKRAEEAFGVAFDTLTSSDASSFIRNLQQAA